MLAMIDSYVFAGGELVRPRNEAEEVRAVMSFLDTHPLPKDTPQTLKELAAVVVKTYDPHSIPLFQEIIRNNPDFIYNLCAVMLNHLALARRLRREGYGQALVMPRTWNCVPVASVTWLFTMR